MYLKNNKYNMCIKRINFDNNYGHGYIEVIDRGYERNTTYEIVVDDTYGDATEEDVINEIEQTIDKLI